MDNKQLEAKRKEAENKIYIDCIDFLTANEDGKKILEQIEDKITPQQIISVIKMFSLVCSKIATSTEIYITKDVTEYRIETMIDKLHNVNYLKKILNLTNGTNSVPGVRTVSSIPDASYTLEQEPVIPDNLKVIPFYALKQVEGEVINQLIFYIL